MIFYSEFTKKPFLVLVLSFGLVPAGVRLKVTGVCICHVCFMSSLFIYLILNAGPMLIAVFITEMVILHKYVYLLLLLFIQ